MDKIISYLMMGVIFTWLIVILFVLPIEWAYGGDDPYLQGFHCSRLVVKQTQESYMISNMPGVNIRQELLDNWSDRGLTYEQAMQERNTMYATPKKELDTSR